MKIKKKTFRVGQKKKNQTFIKIKIISQIEFFNLYLLIYVYIIIVIDYGC